MGFNIISTSRQVNIECILNCLEDNVQRKMIPSQNKLKYYLERAGRTGKLIGMDIVEITPSSDINGITSLTAGQLILNFIGACIRANSLQI